MERYNQNNPYIITASGKLFHILNPTAEEFTIEDIAHSLSKLCRFTGHTNRFYSVAEHSCYVSDLGQTRDEKLWGLLHDASEAFIGDVSTPLKSLLPDYREIEERIMYVIVHKYGLPWPMPEIIKLNDTEVFWAETERLFPTASLIDWGLKHSGRRSSLMIQSGVSSDMARSLFISKFVSLT